MDLLDRGRSLSELGGALRWSDVHAMLLHLPAGSHVRRLVAPEVVHVEQWTTPEVILLGALFDANEAEVLARAGEDRPERGIVSRMLQKVARPDAPSVGADSVVKAPVVSASAIRQAVKARETPK